AGAHVTARAFAEKFRIKRVHDVGYDQGISHQLVADLGYGIPGTVLVCSDSHTCSAGVFNCLARGVGGPDVFYSAIKGETWFRCGKTVRYQLTGKLPKAVTTKDAFLQIAGKHGAHATMNVEYGGPGMASLSINARKTLTTMSAELSAEFATFEPDPVLIDWVRSRNSTPFEPVYADDDAQYHDTREVDLSSLEPLVAYPDTVVQNSRPVKDAAGIKIDQAYIGSCANGTLDDLELAAQVVVGRRVAPGVRFIVTPASQLVYREALKSGALEKLADAGAMIAPPTCGACGGGHMGVIGPEETCITATTRNFKGRMGDPTSKVYMGSPATVAASALTGYITDPREFLN
ncbi:MAG: 3-isopropylmalate dehydratase large subunit, partial [Burkholderiales bacterium]